MKETSERRGKHESMTRLNHRRRRRLWLMTFKLWRCLSAEPASPLYPSPPLAVTSLHLFWCSSTQIVTLSSLHLETAAASGFNPAPHSSQCCTWEAAVHSALPDWTFETNPRSPFFFFLGAHWKHLGFWFSRNLCSAALAPSAAARNFMRSRGAFAPLISHLDAEEVNRMDLTYICLLFTALMLIQHSEGKPVFISVQLDVCY